MKKQRNELENLYICDLIAIEGAYYKALEAEKIPNEEIRKHSLYLSRFFTFAITNSKLIYIHKNSKWLKRAEKKK